MKNYSIWKDNIKMPEYPSLKENKIVDVLIIGGGITGISTLYHLKDSKYNVMLVEQNRLGMSTTANSTGKLSYLQNDLVDKIRKHFDDKTASLYLESQRDAIQLILNAIEDEQIDCDLEKVKSSIYTSKSSEIPKLENLASFFNSNNIKSIKESTNLVKQKYMFSVDDTYTIQPIKLLYGLIENYNFNIYENTSILKIEKDQGCYLCFTKEGIKIKTKWVVIASHYPYFNIPFLFPLKASLEKSYLSASKTNQDKVSLISYSNPFVSIRNYKKYLIYLSNSHLLNIKINDQKNFDELLNKLKNIQLKPDYLWSNSDIITNDGIPYIGTLKDNMLIGTGYNTWGLTNGFLAGRLLSDIILNKDNKYISLFSAKRFNIWQITGGISNAGKSALGYINGVLNKPKNVTVDYDNNSKFNNKCPHMGCQLIYNKVEKTWDCPCHGSRFTNDGKYICAPANRDIQDK